MGRGHTSPLPPSCSSVLFVADLTSHIVCVTRIDNTLVIYVVKMSSHNGPNLETEGQENKLSTISELVSMEQASSATVASMGLQPHIASVSVRDSSKIHFGPKFVKVTKNITNTEGLRARFLGLELMSTRRMRCSVAVFVCWALIVASGLGFYVANLVLHNQSRLDIGLNATWYLRRADWQAGRPIAIEFRRLPLQYVLIGHSATPYCNDKYSCIKAVKEIQLAHLDRQWDDIGPNYLVGGNGLIFEGRGANVVSAMVISWNVKSLNIMFLGDYTTNRTDQSQFDHLNIFLDVLVKENVLTPDYILYGVCQVATYTVTPGPRVMESMRNFTHWKPDKASTCLPK